MLLRHKRALSVVALKSYKRPLPWLLAKHALAFAGATKPLRETIEVEPILTRLALEGW
jgi:hypothetical protein